jgi:methionyl-tRNA formyltransferase
MSEKNAFAFFGSSQFSIYVLDALKTCGLMPSLIVNTPDKPKGRGLAIVDGPVKQWALKNNIEILEPANLKSPDFHHQLSTINSQLFIVASYGKLVPKTILDMPKSGALNVHPSLLPKFRGPSPIQTSILADEKETGVTIMLMDGMIDHGPIVAQEKIAVKNWPPKESELELILGRAGGQLLAKVIPDWMDGKIAPKEQNHTEAAFTKKIVKEDGLIDLTSDPYKNYLKIRAFDTWPGTFFFAEKKGRKIRVVIKSATFRDGKLKIERVVPEGKKEMSYEDFLRGMK